MVPVRIRMLAIILRLQCILEVLELWEFPLVSPSSPNHLSAMIRTKTLTWPLVSAIFATATISAKADVAFEISTHKGYRQHRDSKIQFFGGDFDVFLRDGNGWFKGLRPCCVLAAERAAGPLPRGSTAFVHFGDVNPETPERRALLLDDGSHPGHHYRTAPSGPLHAQGGSRIRWLVRPLPSRIQVTACITTSTRPTSRSI